MSETGPSALVLILITSQAEHDPSDRLSFKQIAMLGYGAIPNDMAINHHCFTLTSEKGEMRYPLKMVGLLMPLLHTIIFVMTKGLKDFCWIKSCFLVNGIIVRH